MTFSADIRMNNVGRELDKAVASGIFAVSEQALKDCNFYCKQDTSALINSSLIHSEPKKGILRWVTPYAEHQYTYPGTRLDKNPNASPEWCERAREAHGDVWTQIFAKAVTNHAG